VENFISEIVPDVPKLGDKLCKCGCGQYLFEGWGQLHDYIKGHKPHVGGHHVSKVPSKSKTIHLEASTTSVPLMVKFAEAKVEEYRQSLEKWQVVVKILRTVM
jgi:hypothetical protein